MALDVQQIIADLKESTVLEINELVEAIEEEFGVEAAAPVAAAGAGPAAAFHKTECCHESGAPENPGQV